MGKDVTQMELVPYTEHDIDSELADLTNKREINGRNSNGIQVIAYFLVAENVTTIWVYDERVGGGCEFEVPKDEVRDWFEHPFAHPNAQLPKGNNE